jgi:hypothetical protein
VFTKNNDFKTPSNSFYIQRKIKSPILGKYFYQPNYSTDKSILKRIPDYRTQLLWEPQINIEDQNSIKLDFYTSDVTGVFEIVVLGYVKDGEKVIIKKYIEVK